MKTKRFIPDGFAKQIGKGRPKGSPNKTTALLKDAILKAAQIAGNKVGEEGMVSYLAVQAEENPGPFMSLLGKVLPMQITGDEGGAIQVTWLPPESK